jgi:hypothetical protein
MAYSALGPFICEAQQLIRAMRYNSSHLTISPLSTSPRSHPHTNQAAASMD